MLSVAKAAARDAADLILHANEIDRKTSNKSTITDLVTKTDKNAEQVIKDDILAKFPDHSILAEESGETKSSSEYLWVIDPLDGTTNFVHGLSPYCVSIALLKNNTPLLAVISELPAENLYWAVKGNGAFCNGEKISVSSRKSINDSLLITGFSYQHDSKWETNMKLFKDFTKISHGVRRIGSAAADLCYVASGKADAFWEIGLYPWDSAAGILLVDEAGGKVTRMDGRPYNIFDEQILATNNLIHDEMLENIYSETSTEK
jgi:myo-inositol-1(or 4)-monophosphatase|tara:strand:- start:8476 stop:9258 length:783 start_codon:yes stop_codon:yes gene_type:complete